jgi:uncharacterized protein (DUF4415 family)
MKGKATSKPSFDKAAMAKAIADAPTVPVDDADNPPTRPEDWESGIATPGGGVEATVEIIRRRRGKQRTPLKVPTTIRLDADVLTALKASGKGWQTRVNEVLREYVERHR